jgi:cell wall-associated NlpC family hydrolase
VSAENLDPRRYPYRADLAAEALRGRVTATRYTAGTLAQVAQSATPVHGRPDARSTRTSEALFGEVATVYEEAQGWAWVQLQRDGYVGYLRADALSARVRRITHRVGVLGTFLYPTPDIKAPPCMPLSMNAEVAITEVGSAFAKLDDGSFLPARHITELDRHTADFVTVAEAFIGVPYLWGGKTRLGVDCSGLLQLALHAAGIACPRDSDMQLASVGRALTMGADLGGLARGDLVFWPGHVGVMVDACTLLHANAHHMAVAAEPLRAAADRTLRLGTAITAVKRLAPRAPTR